MFKQRNHLVRLPQTGHPVTEINQPITITLREEKVVSPVCAAAVDNLPDSVTSAARSFVCQFQGQVQLLWNLVLLI